MMIIKNEIAKKKSASVKGELCEKENWKEMDEKFNNNKLIGSVPYRRVTSVKRTSSLLETPKRSSKRFVNSFRFWFEFPDQLWVDPSERQ